MIEINLARIYMPDVCIVRLTYYFIHTDEVTMVTALFDFRTQIFMNRFQGFVR